MQNGTAPSKTSKTALIVDDSPSVRALVSHNFLQGGFDLCPEASNGKDAIDVARECKPDVIILDLSMPVMNGLEAAPHLRKLFPLIPIILFTLHADALSHQDISILGITAIISKSEPLDNLLKTARELIES